MKRYSVKKLPLSLIAIASAVVLSSCASIKPVEPWEKSTLAKETMKPSGTVPALGKIDGHVYYSKEAVRGGSGVGGGGCGCN